MTRPLRISPFVLRMHDDAPTRHREIYRFDCFLIDAGEQQLSRDGEVIPLTVKLFQLLLALVRAPGSLRTREELVESVWPNTIVEEHSLTSRIWSLRKALGDEGQPPRFIETVRGRGYRFIADVRREDHAATATSTPIVAPRSHVRTIAAVALLAVVVAASLFLYLRNGTRAAAPSNAIAVMPFENLSSDAEDAYFARGMHDMIVGKLAGLAELRVIAHIPPSRGIEPDPRATARELGVSSLLEGSVQKSGDRALIHLRLVDATSGAQLWAETYERQVDHLFDVESETAAQVVAALSVQLGGEDRKRLAEEPTRDGKAYELFLQAEHYAHQVEEGSTDATAAAFARAKELYGLAIARDPTFALAKARESFLLMYGLWFGVESDMANLPVAEQLAKEALASGLAEAHLAMGYVRYWGHRDYPTAIAEFEQAARAAPNDASAISALAFIQRRRGDWKQALDDLRQAELRDPRNALWFVERAATYAQLRCYVESAAEYDRAFAIDPANYRAHADKAMMLLLAGRFDEADAILAGARENVDSSGVLADARYHAAMLRGDPKGALDALAGVTNDWVERSYRSSVPVALMRGRARALMGDDAGAQRDFAAARELLQKSLVENPDNFNSQSALAITLAGLGDRAAGLEQARQATQLLPSTIDAMSGPSQRETLAEVYAIAGDAPEATRLLAGLTSEAAGMIISADTMRRDPVWNAIRDDPEFQRLIDASAGASEGSSAAVGTACVDTSLAERR